jgi:hypothetical protein
MDGAHDLGEAANGSKIPFPVPSMTGLVRFSLPGALAITSNCELLLLIDQRLTSCLMIGNVGGDRSYTFTIQFSNGFFPIAITVLRPLKRKLRDLPRLTKKRCRFQSRTEYPPLQFRLIWFPGRAAQREIEKDCARRLERHAGFPKRAHT